MNNIIEGMTILEQIPIKEYTTLSFSFFGLGIFIAIMACFVLAVKTIPKNKIDFKSKLFKGFLFFYIFGIVAMLFSIIHFPWFYEETGRYTYKCTLDDNISANYIDSNFDIIDVEDGVWTLKDKE